MRNQEMQPYNARREFAVDKVYQKLTQGMGDLSPADAVDGLLYGADSLREGVDQLIEKVYRGAEEQQGIVLNERAERWTAATSRVQESIRGATTNGDYESVESCLKDATQTSLAAREAVSKMKFIKERGQGGYDSRKEVEDYVEELRDFADNGYDGGAPRIEAKILR